MDKNTLPVNNLETEEIKEGVDFNSLIKKKEEEPTVSKKMNEHSSSHMNKKLSFKTFIFFSTLILILGLIFVGGLNYILNIQFNAPKLYSPTGKPITSAPKSLVLDLQNPEDDTLTFESSILVSGSTSPFLDILISSQTKDVLIKSKADGSFSTVFNLDEGVNRINIAVFDKLGENRSEQRTIYYSKEKLQ